MAHSEDDLKLSVFVWEFGQTLHLFSLAPFSFSFVLLYGVLTHWCLPLVEIKNVPKTPKRLSQESMPSHIKLLLFLFFSFLRCVNICININSTSESNWTRFIDMVNRNGILSPWIKVVSIFKSKNYCVTTTLRCLQVPEFLWGDVVSHCEDD